jgi:hypothetical protein
MDPGDDYKHILRCNRQLIHAELDLFPGVTCVGDAGRREPPHMLQISAINTWLS